MKEYLATYKFWKIQTLNCGNIGFEFVQNHTPNQCSYRFEAQNNSAAKKMANKYKSKLHRDNSATLGKLKKTLMHGARIKHPKLEELLKLTPIPVK
jgi:ERCC4-related helicase|tara:strand:+ start:214 stop:501 length:288 start_codon:yes stop_codon:yes gene_type:complete